MSCEEVLAEMTARLVAEPAAGAAAPSPEVEEHLAACAGCRAEAEALGALWNRLALLEAAPPEAELRERFDAVLAAYQAGLAAAEEPAAAPWWRRWVRFPAGGGLQLAYGLLALVLGVGLGALLVGRGAGPGDVKALRGEVRALNDLVTLSLLEAPSASERLQGVSYGSRMARPDREVVTALVRAATEDENVNVRLAAIEALAPVASEPRVLSPLVAALPAQESPMVQVALVDLLLASDGETARRACTALLADETLNPDVRRHVRERLSAL
ncbi:MAG TPA: hypothetical protein VJG13_00105 [Thermoanaerobaculia bacterium]|nr:hypothetical protein [Thermoanaerobaculia bacterium]